MIKHLKKLNSAGDTIVEVMIVLAVLGLAISISYATASQGLQKSRNAEEHSQALGIINSQVELARSAFNEQVGTALTDPSLAGTAFCLAPPAAATPANPTPTVTVVPIPSTGPNAFDENIKADHLETTRPCMQNALYNVSVKNRGNGLFDFRVRWNGLGKLGPQQEQLTYRIDGTSVVAGGFSDGPVVSTCWNGTVIVTPPGGTCPPQVGTVTCLPSGVPMPVGTCPPDTFSWRISGAAFYKCVNDPTDPKQNDHADGCNPSSNPAAIPLSAVFARRGVDITYNFRDAAITGFMGYGPATLIINFNQYAGANTVPPDGYSYHVVVKVDGTVVATVDLTPTQPVALANNGHGAMTSRSWNAKSSPDIPITLAANKPNKIELEWTNNNINPPAGRDPDLQINYIKLDRP